MPIGFPQNPRLRKGVAVGGRRWYEWLASPHFPIGYQGQGHGQWGPNPNHNPNYGGPWLWLWHCGYGSPWLWRPLAMAGHNPCHVLRGHLLRGEDSDGGCGRLVSLTNDQMSLKCILPFFPTVDNAYCKACCALSCCLICLFEPSVCYHLTQTTTTTTVLGGNSYRCSCSCSNGGSCCSSCGSSCCCSSCWWQVELISK